MSHTIAVSLVASRSVDDERQQNKCSRKKLSEHPCVRVTAVDFLMLKKSNHWTTKPMRITHSLPAPGNRT